MVLALGELEAKRFSRVTRIKGRRTVIPRVKDSVDRVKTLEAASCTKIPFRLAYRCLSVVLSLWRITRELRGLDLMSQCWNREQKDMCF